MISNRDTAALEEVFVRTWDRHRDLTTCIYAVVKAMDRMHPPAVHVVPGPAGRAPRLARVSRLIEYACAEVDITPPQLVGRGNRSAATCEARRIVWGCLRTHGLSLPEIGTACHRDHTSILSGLRGLGDDGEAKVHAIYNAWIAHERNADAVPTDAAASPSDGGVQSPHGSLCRPSQEPAPDHDAGEPGSHRHR